MKNIAFFCIPAHGHTNPMLPVATELVKRGNTVRFYSFLEFENKINATGAQFIACDSFFPEITKAEAEKLQKVSATEITIQDIRMTIEMNDFIEKEFSEFKPDIIYTDSVCFWGKLNAWKFNIPMVVSTSTFAYNQMSAKYIKNTPAEIADMVFGLFKIKKELKKLKTYGYHVKSALSLIQNDNKTDTVVYVSRGFQPYVESFSDHYLFAGPSVFSKSEPSKEKDRALIYVSMGTVINNLPDFYKKCIEAFKDINADIIISCGKIIDIKTLGTIPENIKVYEHVNQLEILSKADVFISHCGMNSASESLYMATPMVLYPQTGEQYAVARRVQELGAGIFLKEKSVTEILNAVNEILNNEKYANNATKCSIEFRNTPGIKGIADFIENAPYISKSTDVLAEMNKKTALFQIFYWIVVIILLILFGNFISWHFVWIPGIIAGIIRAPIVNLYKTKCYEKLIK